MSPGGSWVSTRTASPSHHLHHLHSLHPPPQLAIPVVSRPPPSAVLRLLEPGNCPKGGLGDTSGLEN
ncbi:unnamed protein product, partial [Vitis vinifera]